MMRKQVSDAEYLHQGGSQINDTGSQTPNGGQQNVPQIASSQLKMIDGNNNIDATKQMTQSHTS